MPGSGDGAGDYDDDPVILEEIDLTAAVMIAASEADEPLPTAEIDKLLGLDGTPPSPPRPS